MSVAQLTIARLGQRGDGVAAGLAGPVYVPYAVPGDHVRADLDGDIGHIIEITQPSSQRIAPICPYFGTCGGCAVQTLAPGPYAAWKRTLVADALAKAGVSATINATVDAHGEGRRRVTFHARGTHSANILARRSPLVGFMRARSHDLVDIAQCPILAPDLDGALAAARYLAGTVAGLDKPLDIVVTATDAGLDVDLRGLGPLPEAELQALTDAAAGLDLARLSNHGQVVLERRTPGIRIGNAQVVPPPGGFLQATVLGERTLAHLVSTGVGPARKVADLFCGLGTFALRLAETATVAAIDTGGPALEALSRAARASPALRPVTTQARDLFRRPLAGSELAPFDAVVFDPPRAGAAEQATTLAQSKVPTVVAISCNPATFARDAAILLTGGYEMGPVTPVDQFRYAPHVEIVAAFRRVKTRRPRPLFG